MSQRYSREAAAALPLLGRPDDTTTVERQDHNRQAVALLERWMSEEDGYDREIWPLVKDELKDLRTRCRE